MTLQKASMSKRIAAFLLDAMLLCTLAVGMHAALSALTGYNRLNGRYEEITQAYLDRYDVDFNIRMDEYENLSPEEAALYEEAKAAIESDTELESLFHKLLSLSVMNLSLAMLGAFLALEFGVPLLFGNGMTLGKKMFGLAVCDRDGVRVGRLRLFVRSLLGKYTVETMIAVITVILIYYGAVGILGTAVLLILGLVQLILLLATPEHRVLHDLLADTVCVDFASQRIFSDRKDLEENKNTY